MNTPIEHITVIALYLPADVVNEYYYKTGHEAAYDDLDFHYFLVDGLTEAAIQDLRNRELKSYAYVITWDPTQEDRLLSCLGAELREAFNAESDGAALRRGLMETLLRKVEDRLRNGLLAEVKAEDDVDWMREYLGGRANR